MDARKIAESFPNSTSTNNTLASDVILTQGFASALWSCCSFLLWLFNGLASSSFRVGLTCGTWGRLVATAGPGPPDCLLFYWHVSKRNTSKNGCFPTGLKSSRKIQIWKIPFYINLPENGLSQDSVNCKESRNSVCSFALIQFSEKPWLCWCRKACQDLPCLCFCIMCSICVHHGTLLQIFIWASNAWLVCIFVSDSVW